MKYIISRMLLLINSIIITVQLDDNDYNNNVPIDNTYNTIDNTYNDFDTNNTNTNSNDSSEYKKYITTYQDYSTFTNIFIIISLAFYIILFVYKFSVLFIIIKKATHIEWCKKGIELLAHILLDIILIGLLIVPIRYSNKYLNILCSIIFSETYFFFFYSFFYKKKQFITFINLKLGPVEINKYFEDIYVQKVDFNNIKEIFNSIKGIFNSIKEIFNHIREIFNHIREIIKETTRIIEVMEVMNRILLINEILMKITPLSIILTIINNWFISTSPIMKYILRNINNKFNIFSLPIASTNITLFESFIFLLLSLSLFYSTCYDHIYTKYEKQKQIEHERKTIECKKKGQINCECKRKFEEIQEMNRKNNEIVRELQICEESGKNQNNIKNLEKESKKLSTLMMKGMCNLRSEYYNSCWTARLQPFRKSKFSCWRKIEAGVYGYTHIECTKRIDNNNYLFEDTWNIETKDTYHDNVIFLKQKKQRYRKKYIVDKCGNEKNITDKKTIKKNDLGYFINGVKEKPEKILKKKINMPSLKQQLKEKLESNIKEYSEKVKKLKKYEESGGENKNINNNKEMIEDQLKELKELLIKMRKIIRELVLISDFSYKEKITYYGKTDTGVYTDISVEYSGTNDNNYLFTKEQWQESNLFVYNIYIVDKYGNKNKIINERIINHVDLGYYYSNNNRDDWTKVEDLEELKKIIKEEERKEEE